MARIVPEKDISVILAAAEYWKNECLVNDGSVFSPEKLWSLENFQAFETAFVDNPIDDSDLKFFEKLEKQLSDYPVQISMLASECLWLLFLIQSNITPSKKNENIRRVWEGVNNKAEYSETYLSEEVLSGISHTGMGYNSHRWRELTYLIRLCIAFKERDLSDRKALISDPWRFLGWQELLPVQGNRQFRHVLRFLCFPDTFERITTSSDKIKIVSHYLQKPISDVKQLSDSDIDNRLLDIRNSIEAEGNLKIFDFYLDDILEEWSEEEIEDEDTENTVIGSVAHLPDLHLVVADCQGRLDRFDDKGAVIIGDSLWKRIVQAYTKKSPSDKLTIVGGHTLWIDTPDKKIVAISAQELPRCWATIPYIAPIEMYKNVLLELAEFLGYASPTASKCKNIFSKMPASDWRDEVPAGVAIKIDEFLNRRFLSDDISKERFLKFLGDSDWFDTGSKLNKWSGVSKKLDRTDWIEASIQYVGGWLAVGAARRGPLVEALSEISGLGESLESALKASKPTFVEPFPQSKFKTGAENIIYYGAPGTGKTHTVDAIIDGQMSVRTVFHPDIQNSDFIGALKPVMRGDAVTYAFAPGPFANALKDAWTHPEKAIYLVIEELNRAPAAAVFGELFLLLDRDSTGLGKYDVDFPSDEFRDWFQKETGQNHLSMRVPSNLSILATMNSADQGVYPLDTAFRRRWRQEYVPIDFVTAPKGGFEIVKSDGTIGIIQWAKFAKTLNAYILGHLAISEDRLLGPWFVTGDELNRARKAPGKVLIYLWDDLLRHEGRELIFDKSSVPTYGVLSGKLQNSERIFSDNLLDALEPKIQSITDSSKDD